MQRRLLLPLIALLSLVAVSCQWQLVEPPGEGEVRYRDQIFSEVTETSDLVYGSAPDENGDTVQLRLDLYEPTGDTVSERPAIVWIHGGSFAFGNKSSPDIVDQANVFARKGFVTVAINYRLSESGCSASGPTTDCLAAMLDAKHDAQAAVRWLRANASTYGIDTDRIAAAGTSAGAITALHVGYGADDPGSSGNPGHPSDVGAAISLSGAHIIAGPDPGEAWALLLHGSSDVVVPYAWAENTVAQAESAGTTANLTTWPGEGHVPYGTHRTQIHDETTNFLYWSLRLFWAET